MKTLIRKWLGIEPPPPPTDLELRKRIGEALTALLDGKPDNEVALWLDFDYASKFRSVVQFEVAKATAERIDACVTAYVKSEAFLDQVIERIRRKQLS